MKTIRHFSIGARRIGPGEPCYFIADIAANHDGSLARAVELIHLAARAGADAAKFQHFKARTIVSDAGFRALKPQSHQATWKKSVFEVYQDASVSLDWTATLVAACAEAGISFFTSPYDFALVDAIDPYVPAFKIGSGDITWLEMIGHIARKGKPYIIACGASTMDEVEQALAVGLEHNEQVALLQCNTNYTASLENFHYVNLRVLEKFRERFPGLILGLSDHTPGHATVLGAVTLGACIVEKHFTDDTSREGPDHRFSMDPATWRDMVDRTRELEAALGDGVKRVEANELETVVLQRRALRAARALPAGTRLTATDVVALRPCPDGALPPYRIASVLGRLTRRALADGDLLVPADLDD
ncbi:MAG TPA: N-acetylneuraminate synthase family protein [Steroidobacteraceae bacterium]|nr:N-acetylneuraminate synthase family protein [Steroidobacteraceae bacterium]